MGNGLERQGSPGKFRSISDQFRAILTSASAFRSHCRDIACLRPILECGETHGNLPISEYNLAFSVNSNLNSDL